MLSSIYSCNKQPTWLICIHFFLFTALFTGFTGKQNVNSRQQFSTAWYFTKINKSDKQTAGYNSQVAVLPSKTNVCHCSAHQFAQQVFATNILVQLANAFSVSNAASEARRFVNLYTLSANRSEDPTTPLAG